MMTVGQAVRSLRKRLGKNQLEFAELLSCQRNTVSRFELENLPPGPLILMRLLQIAKSSGDSPDEEAAITRELKSRYEQGEIGGTVDVDALVSRITPLLEELRRADVIMSALPMEKILDFGFRQFVPAVAHIIEKCDTVDQSVTDVLQLWAAHSKNKEVVEYFREAAGFLKGQLWNQKSKRTSPVPRKSGSRGRKTG